MIVSYDLRRLTVGLSRWAGAGRSLRCTTNLKARRTADLRARSAVGCNLLLYGQVHD